MNSRTEILSQSLASLTYNGGSLKIPKEQKLNIYMGIGLWSAKDGLTTALPVDVMQMLLSATVLRTQISEANPGKQSNVILLIADSMAVNEGADQYKVAEIVSLYKKCLDPLLGLLNLKEHAEIMLSSDLEGTGEYQATLHSLKSSKILQQLEGDGQHYNYICTQTAITQCLYAKRDVGVKVGWLLKSSGEKLNDRSDPASWDELKFDRLHQAICPDSTIQSLYARAGMKQGRRQDIQIEEGCPYTAYEKDSRYVVQTQNKRDISTICPLQKRVAAQWQGVADVCTRLREMQIVSDRILPDPCIHPTNNVVTVYRMLNHWSNSPEMNLNDHNKE